jgi:hypothetical protein
MDAISPEELSGPFVESSITEEFGYEEDLSNPVDSTREPFPRSRKAG